MHMHSNPSQIQSILRAQLQLQWQQPSLAHILPAFMLWGPPGVGKSSLIRALCEELGIDFTDVRLAQREPVDMRGLPVPRGEVVHWLLSSEWPRDPHGRGIILFDELTAADPALQVAAYEFILDRRLGDLYQVPDGWLICAAGNRAEDRTGCSELPSAMANRFCHLELEAELEQWLYWAAKQQVHPAVTAFLRFKPPPFFDMSGDTSRGWPSPRSWERVSTLLKHLPGMPQNHLDSLVVGLVGEAAGRQFRRFQKCFRQLPDIEALLEGHEQFKQPERADLTHAIATSLAWHLWRGHRQEKQQRERIGRFLEITTGMSSDFATITMLNALQQGSCEEQSQRAELIFSHPGFVDWSRSHGEAMASVNAPPGMGSTAQESDNFAIALERQRRHA